jgi:PAS domain S-box-containing protein
MADPIGPVDPTDGAGRADPGWTAAPGVAAVKGAAEVLVVDDHPGTRYSTSRVMRAAGFGTREATTGSEGLALANGSLSAVILDMHLPDINGFEVCQRLRAKPETANVPVICLSAAYVRDDDKVQGLDSGADAYIVHPADPALLVATVKALIRARGAEESMRRSEARFRAVFDNALSGICLIDAGGRFVDANPAMLALLQRRKADVVGHRLVDFAPPDWGAHIEAYLEQSQAGMWRGDFPLSDAAGELVYLEWHVSAHLEPGLSLAVASDVSERLALLRQREELLEREQAARAAAEHVSRAKDDFMAVLSHELRTPLNAILNWVQVLKHSRTASLERGLDTIERNARAQTHLISDLLDVSRLDLGKLRLHHEPIQPRELLENSINAFDGQLAEKSIRIALETSGVRQAIMADGARLQQVIWNLLSNAIKFSEPGGCIHVRLDQGEERLTLDVKDEGQGIKPEFLPYLFERFTQSDSASNRFHGGLGLGLSIVKRLVELHGGTITAASAGPGSGATFTVTIPVRAVKAELSPGGGQEDGPTGEAGRSRTGDSPVASGEPGAADLAGMKIVVVEDDREAREVLVMILGERGATVVAASDYAQGLECIEEFRPDILVSDIGMAGNDGYALVRDVRRRESAGTARLPAIALTAFARARDRELAIEAGFDAHCAKPLDIGELVATVLRLARSRARN